ncbi:MAG: DUF4430 domain-containing protein [Oscillospiraceae bacterium]|nr:DUF4430 domain-containing protein [Oscillospiraceae bacterium]
MKKTNLLSRISSLLLCIVLIAAMALSLGACAADDAKNPDVKESERPQQVQQDENIVGEGDISFKFIVVDADGKETEFTVKTDADTVGKALLDANLIAGEDSEYGLYVKTVNGITADYDTDGSYWAFYINGEYATTGVDSTEIEDGATYTFKVEKG